MAAEWNKLPCVGKGRRPQQRYFCTECEIFPTAVRLISINANRAAPLHPSVQHWGATVMTLENLVPALVVALLIAGFLVSFVWRLYIGPGANPDDSLTGDGNSRLPPD
jgi:hypothetical protein